MREQELIAIKKAVYGDKEAFSQLYKENASRILRFIILRVKDIHEAENLVHEVFLKAWQNIYKYEDRGWSFYSWLYKIARNTIADYYRVKRITEIDIEEEFEDVEDTDVDIEKDTDIKMNVENLREFFDVLPKNYKEVLILNFVEDMSVDEIAKIINKTPQTTRVVLHRAIKKIKELVKNEKNF